MRVSLRFVPAVLVAGIGLCSCGYHSKESYLAKGNKAFSNGQYEDAQILYKKALQKDINYGEAYYRLGLLDLKRNDPSEAYAAFVSAVRLQPNNVDAKTKLADICFTAYGANPNHPRNLYDQAAKYAGELVKQDPNSPDGLRLQGEMALVDRDFSRAIGLFQKALAAHPDLQAVRLRLAQAYVGNNQMPEAEKAAQAGIQVNRKSPALYEFLYELYRKENRAQDAQNDLIAWIAADPGNTAGYLRLARYDAEFGKEDDMRATLDRLLNDHQRFPKGRLTVGEFYLSIRRPNDALTQFKTGESENPKDNLQYRKAIVSTDILIGQPQEAEREVDAILSNNGGDDDTRVMKASMLMNRGKVDEAIAIYRDLAQHKDGDPVRHYNLARGLLAKGDLAEARKELITANKLNPHYLPPRYSLAQLELQTGNNREALEYATNLLAERPNERQAQLVRVAALEGLGQFQEARAGLNHMLDQNASDLDAEVALAALNIREKRFSEAEETLTRLNTPGQRDLRPLQELIDLRLQQNQPDRAIAVAREFAAKAATPAQGKLLVADTEWRANKLDAAAGDYRQLVAGGNVPVGALLRLAAYDESRGNRAQGLDELRKAAQMAPREPTVLDQLASALQQGGQTDEAIETYKRSRDLRPNDPAVLNNLAFLLADKKQDMDGALKLAQQAATAAPKDPEYQDTLAWVYIQKGQPENAMPILNGLLRNNPERAEFHYHMAVALAGAGKSGEARQELTTALERKPSDQDRAGIEALLAKLGKS